MKISIQIIFLVLVSNCVLSSQKTKTTIKAPLNDNEQCESVNVEWKNNKLVTITGDSGMIFCKSTGYIGLINKEDKLSDKEVKSIKKFLKQAKKLLGIKKDSDFLTMSIIDSLWLIKNIYERRDLSPRQHIDILDRIKKISLNLTEEIIVEREELRRDCLGKAEDDQWCRAFTLKNKVWEEYHKKKVKKANEEDEYRRIQERILAKAKEQEQQGAPSLCNDFNLAKQLALQIMQVQLEGKIKFKEISHTEVNDGEKFSFTYERVMKIKRVENTWWKIGINKKSCEADFLNGR